MVVYVYRERKCSPSARWDLHLKTRRRWYRLGSDVSSVKACWLHLHSASILDMCEWHHPTNEAERDKLRRTSLTFMTKAPLPRRSLCDNSIPSICYYVQPDR